MSDTSDESSFDARLARRDGGSEPRSERSEVVLASGF